MAGTEDVCDVRFKLLSEINSMYVDNLAYFSVKGGESECLRIDCAARQSCIISPLLCSYEGGEKGDRKEGNEISGGGRRVEIVWPLVCRCLGSVY